MQKLYFDVLYLLSGAANNKKAEKNKIDNMNLDALYSLCKAHSITALVSSVFLEHIKENPEQYAKWSQEQMKALYRDMNFASERAKILAFLEENGIWYMPLKGVILKDYYPRPELREFADNDILMDESRAADVREFMLANGYIKGEEDADENIFKHFRFSGVGIRSLLDIYVYYKAKEKTLDHAYIKTELAKMEADLFETEMRMTALKAFGEKKSAFYVTYYCKPEVDISKLKNLYFYIKELDYTIELDYKDLFFKASDGNNYFLIYFNADYGSDDSADYFLDIW